VSLSPHSSIDEEDLAAADALIPFHQRLDVGSPLVRVGLAPPLRDLLPRPPGPLQEVADGVASGAQAEGLPQPLPAAALVAKFDSKDARLRIASAEAAARIDPGLAEKSTRAIVSVLTDTKLSRGMPRSMAAASLQKIGPSAKAAVPTLIDLLTDAGPFHADFAVAAVLLDPDKANGARAWIKDQLVNNGEDASDSPPTPDRCLREGGLAEAAIAAHRQRGTPE
jgi:hypothetical protein